MSDAPEIMDTYIDDEGTNHNAQEIRIYDGQNFRIESVYNFTFRYNENVDGLEDRLAGDYAISLDGEHIYYYDQAEDYYVEYIKVTSKNS